jgi:hypothetical protein
LESIGGAALRHANPIASVHSVNRVSRVCCGTSEHPIKLTAKAPTKSGLMKTVPFKKQLRNFGAKAIKRSLSKWLALPKALHG